MATPETIVISMSQVPDVHRTIGETGADAPTTTAGEAQPAGSDAGGDAVTVEVQAQPAEASGATGDGDQGAAAPTAPTAPPRTGTGSGKEAWTAYATELGLTVPEDATRDQIIALVDDRQQA